MTEHGSIYEAPEGQQEPSDKAWLQRLFDNMWLLLALGFMVPFLSYTVWAWVELLLAKKADLP